LGVKLPEEELCDQLLRRRLKFGLSTRIVDRAIGGGNGNVSGWEGLRHFPRLDLFVAWADVLEMDVILVPRKRSQRGPK
jgi:hypothetical protein